MRSVGLKARCQQDLRPQEYPCLASSSCWRLLAFKHQLVAASLQSLSPGHIAFSSPAVNSPSATSLRTLVIPCRALQIISPSLHAQLKHICKVLLPYSDLSRTRTWMDLDIIDGHDSAYRSIFAPLWSFASSSFCPTEPLMVHGSHTTSSPSWLPLKHPFGFCPSCQPSPYSSFLIPDFLEGIRLTSLSSQTMSTSHRDLAALEGIPPGSWHRRGQQGQRQ